MKDRSRIVFLIGLFRLTKAIALVAAGLGALELLKPGMALRVREWLQGTMPIAAEPAMRALSQLTPARIELASAALFAYAALFVTEGVGLMLERVWAEYLTIVATASFIPFEIYEIAKRVTAIRVAMLVVNVAIVLYLVWRRWRRPVPSVGAGS